MIRRQHHDGMNIDYYDVRTQIYVRNYYEETEAAEKMWEYVKGEHTLFDFNKIIEMDYDEEQYEKFDDDDKLRIMENHWGCRSNAMYARFLDDGEKYAIEFTTRGFLRNVLMHELACEFPTLEFLVVQAQKGYTHHFSADIREYKSDDYNSIYTPSDTYFRYVLYKILWQNEFKEPMAFDISGQDIVFLDEPWERNPHYMQQRGIFYAGSINKLTEFEVFKRRITDCCQLSRLKSGSTPSELVYYDTAAHTKKEENEEEKEE